MAEARRRGVGAPRPGRVRLVVVDDDADIRLILTMFARADGRFEVVGQAQDGVQAAMLVADRCPDVAIMDVQMPHRDGIAAIPHLRANCPPIGIVMYSANSGQAEHALDVGADAWHTKGDPVTAVLDSAAMVGAAAQLEAIADGSTPPNRDG